MIQSPFWPLVWKEYRASRAFWLAMAGMGLVAQGGVAWLAHRPADRDWWLYGIALMISAGFAVGIGGTLFAIEHEERTFALMRMLPVRARLLGGAKLLWAVIGLAVLLAMLWLAAGALAGWQKLSPRDARELWGLWGLACLEGLAWGVLFSLTIRSPLWATVLAVMAVSLTDQFAVTLTPTHDLSQPISYIEAIPTRLVVLLLVVMADVWLLPRWLAERVPRPVHDGGTQRVSLRRRAIDRVWHWIVPAPESRRMVAHLVWQSWQEAAKYLLLLIVVGPVTWIAVPAIYLGVVRQVFGNLPEILPAPIYMVFSVVLIGILLGILVFHADQRHGPRFLAERGISGRIFWSSRQLAFGGWLPVWAAVLLLTPHLPALFGQPVVPDTYTGNPWELNEVTKAADQERTDNAWLLWEMVVSAYAAGQFASLLVRRGLLALVLAVVLGMAMAGWAWLMNHLSMPAWWSAMPLAWGMLLATWLRAPAWLLQQSHWRHWLAPLAAVLVPAVAIAIQVPRQRVDEISTHEGIASEIIFLTPPTPAAIDAAKEKLEQVREWDEEISHTRPDDLQWQARVVLFERAFGFYRHSGSAETLAEAKATFELYRRARELFRATNQAMDETGSPRDLTIDDDAWTKPILALTIEASRQPYHLGALPLDERTRLSVSSNDLAWLLRQDARVRRSQGELDAALDDYVALLRYHAQRDACDRHVGLRAGSLRNEVFLALRSWAADEGQTPERIRAAIARLREWHEGLPPAYTLLQTVYQKDEAVIEDLPEAVHQGMINLHWLSQTQWLTSRLPWERDRALRMLRQLAEEQLDEGQGMEAALATSMPTEWPIPGGNRRLNRRVIQSPGRTAIDPLATTPLVEWSTLARDSLAWYLLSRETDYRATLIILGLEAWKLEHGSLPSQLDLLVGAGLDAVPLDPLWAQPFLYYPEGLTAIPRPARDEWRTTVRSHFQDLAPGPPPWAHWYYPRYNSGTPFLWSAFSDNRQQSIGFQPVNVGTGDFSYCRDYSAAGISNRSVSYSAVDVLSGGYAYEIP